MMKKEFVTSLLVLLLTVVLVAGCGQSALGGNAAPAASGTPSAAASNAPSTPGNPANDDDVIRIGMVGPLTGASAFGGNECKNAIEMAVEKRGEVLGKKIVFEAADASDATQAISEFERLYAKGCRIFMGPYGSYSDFAIQKVVDEYGAILMSSCGWADELTENKLPNYFHFTPRVAVFGERMGQYMPEYAEKYLGIKKEDLRVGVIWNTNVEYVGKSALNAFADQGINVVYQEGYPIDRKDFTALIAQLQSANVNVLVPCQSSADGIPFRKKMVEMGYEPDMVFAMGLIYDQPDFGELGADIVDGCLVLSYTHPSINRDMAPGLGEFAEGYKAKHGWYPLTHATQMYAGTLFMIDMIDKAGAYDADKVREALESAKIEAGVYPNYWGVEFDEYHRNIRAGDPLAIGQWQGGELIAVGTPEIATGTPIIPWDPSKVE